MKKSVKFIKGAIKTIVFSLIVLSSQVVFGANSTPKISGFNGGTNTDMTFCIGQERCYTFNTSDADTTDSLKVSVSGLTSFMVCTIEKGKKNPKVTICVNANQSNVRSTPYQFIISVDDQSGNSNSKTSKSLRLRVVPSIKPTITTNEISCGTIQYNAKWNSFSSNFLWSGDDSLSDSTSMFKHRYKKAGTYKTIVKTQAKNNECWRMDTSNIIVKDNYLAPPSAKDTSICGAKTISLQSNLTSKVRWHDSLVGVNVLDTNNVLTKLFSTTTTLYLSTYNSSCNSERDSVKVTVNPLPNSSFLITHKGGRKYEFVASDTTLSAYKWDFDDTYSSTLHSDTHSFKDTGYYKIQLTTTNSYGCSSTSDSNLYVIVTSVEELLSLTPFSLFPNPAINNLTLKSDYNGGVIYIKDISGKEVYNTLIGSENQSIHLSLEKGLYIVELHFKGQYSVRKLMME